MFLSTETGNAPATGADERSALLRRSRARRKPGPVEAELPPGRSPADSVELTGEAVAGPELVRRFYCVVTVDPDASGVTPAGVVGEGGLEPPRPFGHRNLNNVLYRPVGCRSVSCTCADQGFCVTVCRQMWRGIASCYPVGLQFGLHSGDFVSRRAGDRGGMVGSRLSGLSSRRTRHAVTDRVQSRLPPAPRVRFRPAPVPRRPRTRSLAGAGRGSRLYGISSYAPMSMTATPSPLPSAGTRRPSMSAWNGTPVGSPRSIPGLDRSRRRSPAAGVAKWAAAT